MTATQENINDEFTKNPELKKKDLQELKCWLGTQMHLPSISEEQLIVFLHSCYYDVARTKNCIETYYTLRTKTPEIFTNRDLKHPENQKMLTVLNYIVLPVTDPNGNNVIFHSLKQTEPSKYSFADAARVYFMMIDWCIQHDGTSPGIVIVFDVTGLRFGHLTKLSLSLIHKILIYIQEGMPVRLKAIHILNTIPIADQIMYLTKPFMNKELQKLIHFHKRNDESIYEYLPKNSMPRDFGGELPTVAELDASYILKLHQLQDYFKEEEKFCVDENKRSNIRKNKDNFVPLGH
ncbi:alpha-tocopherol transfer protein-like [Zootermopsis nevadensis]|uniref:Alpha-tocopherol transfer protein-like n=1 Tax=Zootermopsis nevadensis TaxID=136037 RepID=A0A067R4X7_ZOONE|nr:alpha-tocopherol transfer protein-like [Zootermopsis nevadensis]XP_021922091.1 alpha-tocopherol transfer protein-like [Zootermopsis nevadensis]KDR18315.1 Alpha-tocopherol transfer protein-like [Zootermopsis nevadensis]